MSTYPPHIEALMTDALTVKLGDYATRLRLNLRPAGGIDRSGPCPIVGGTDGFSIHTGKNVWNCRKCGVGGGDVISFAMHVHNCDFKAALEAITGRQLDDLKGETEAQKKARAEKLAAARSAAEAEEQKRLAEADAYRRDSFMEAGQLWTAAPPTDLSDPTDPVTLYLVARGIDVGALVAAGAAIKLRSHRAAPYTRGAFEKKFTLFTGPAMLAPMVRADGKFGGVHATWIDLSKPPKFRAEIPDKRKPGEFLNAKIMRGSKRTAAIPLFTPEGAARIVGGEGIETTLTVLASCFEPGTAYWALMDLGHMAGKAAHAPDGARLPDIPDPADTDAFLPPEWCTEMVYLGDADQSDERARRKIHDELTRGCRRAMAARPGLVAKIAWAAAGMDFNDMAATVPGQDQDVREAVE